MMNIIKHFRKSISITLAGLIIVSSLAGLSWNGYYQIKNNEFLRANVIQLKNDVAMANQHIRNAAIIDDPVQKELELEKRFITRKSATTIYEILKTSDLCSRDRETVKTLLKERSEYRDAQNIVVDSIRKDNREMIARSFVPYQALQERYNSRVDSLISSFNSKIDKARILFGRSLVLLLVITNVLTIIGSRIFFIELKRHKELTKRKSNDIQLFEDQAL